MGHPSVFKLGDHVAFENAGFFSTGRVMALHPDGLYEIRWDDGFEDAPRDDGSKYTYDGYELIPYKDIDPDLVEDIDRASPIPLAPAITECECSHCHEVVDVNDYTYPYCIKCYDNPDGKCD